MAQTSATHTIRCHDCRQEFDASNREAIRTHDCTPTCAHCGKTADDVDNPDDLSAKMVVGDHQRTCDERPSGGPGVDVEAKWREEKREKDEVDKMTRKLEREGVY